MVQSPPDRPDREGGLRAIALANGVMLACTLAAVLAIALNHDGILDAPVLGGLSKAGLTVATVVGIPAIFEPLVRFPGSLQDFFCVSDIR